MKTIKFAAALCAVIMTATSLAGCSSGQTDDESSAESTSSVSNVDVSIPLDEADGVLPDDINTETRPIKDGDDYAINKINNKSPEDSLPGGYKLSGYSEEQQGKLFANGKSKIVINAYNYKEDLQDLAIWADQACAIIKIANFTSACDTNYSEPQNVKLLGFDAIRYDYEIIQYEFVENKDDPNGEKLKNPIGTYKGIAYYFYSDQDAYAIMFDTSEADWEEQSKLFEEFTNDLEITKTEY